MWDGTVGITTQFTEESTTTTTTTTRTYIQQFHRVKFNGRIQQGHFNQDRTHTAEVNYTLSSFNKLP